MNGLRQSIPQFRHQPIDKSVSRVFTKDMTESNTTSNTTVTIAAMSLYDIEITRYQSDDTPASETTLYVTELHQCSPDRDARRYWTDTETSADRALEESFADNGWDISEQYPYGWTARWVRVGQ